MAAETPVEVVVAPSQDLEKAVSRTSKESKERKLSSHGISENSATTAVQAEGPAYDENDPTLPLNWPVWKKYFNLTIPAIITFVVAFGSSIYTPAIVDVMIDFKVSQTVAILPLTTYVLSLGFSGMISAPISETMGRLGTYRYLVPLAAVFTLAAGFAPNFAALCILRFFSGLFGSATFAVSAGTGADLFAPQDRALPGSLQLFAPFLGPAMGPFIGGFVTQGNGWKWSQYALTIILVAFYIPVFFLEETYLKVILARRQKAAGEAPVDDGKLKPKASTLLLGVVFITILRPFQMLVTEPIVIFLSLYVAYNFAVVFTFFGSIPYVFAIEYGFNREETGLVFLGLGLGCVLSIPTYYFLDKMTYMKEWHKLNASGRAAFVPPEHRLWPAMVGGLGLPIGLFWFGWSANKDVHWIVPILGLVPFGWGNLCIFISTAIYLVDTYAALTAASAIAANGFLRYILGGTFPLFTIQMYENLGIGWATSVLGFLSLVLLPIPWVLFKWGPQIRARSRFETNIKNENEVEA
ncbi:putative bicyclomycin resistance protein [Bisporella sp. PMI_857]|nr:putative bicyclomycin resistance protein [Bisporella sp. PMI_857]KAH8600591.1 putative bicyclomycin resistance protein [Bisporella sp. PMI_857]